MTGDYTSLDVSQRLEKAWKSKAKREDKPWWVVSFKTRRESCETCGHENEEQTDKVAVAWVSDHEPIPDDGDLFVPARTPAELEAETWRMGLILNVFAVEDDVRATLAPIRSGITLAVGEAEHVIDAWGNALAEAKEKK